MCHSKTKHPPNVWPFLASYPKRSWSHSKIDSFYENCGSKISCITCLVDTLNLKVGLNPIRVRLKDTPYIWDNHFQQPRFTLSFTLSTQDFSKSIPQRILHCEFESFTKVMSCLHFSNKGSHQKYISWKFPPPLKKKLKSNLLYLLNDKRHSLFFTQKVKKIPYQVSN